MNTYSLSHNICNQKHLYWQESLLGYDNVYKLTEMNLQEHKQH